MISNKKNLSFIDYLDEEKGRILSNLTSPTKIQSFLDKIPYSPEDTNRTPVQVMQDSMAHCLDGAIFAAAALREIGYPPLLIDIFPDPGRDDDHVLAIFKMNNHFGAIAKSNFTGLRYREPIHRTLRELVLTYFDDFFNLWGEKTLRTYTRILKLDQFDRLGWIWNPVGVATIEHRLLTMNRIPLIDSQIVKDISPVDEISYKAGMMIANPDGLYKPDPKTNFSD